MLADPQVECRPYEVMKFSIGFPRRVLVLSVLCGINVHFIVSSRICGGVGCPACKSGLAWKFAGYVAVLFHGTRRLLRLTAASATLGMDGSLWQAGMMVDVEKDKERRPLRVVGVREQPGFDRAAGVSAIELLSVVARLHGLPGLDPDWTVDDGRRLIEKNANMQLALALRGVTS